MIISKGFALDERSQIAALYWKAFGAKLGRVMAPEGKALAFVERVLDPTHSICARDADWALRGVAGFKTMDGALVGGTFRDLSQTYGIWGAVWRAGLLQLLERDTKNARFLMDGIFVDPTARGRGVGTALLDAIVDKARARGYAEVRLDVIDNNPRARTLYERRGFVAGDTQYLGPFKYLFGFSAATTMVRTV
ncbi:MAG: GNAT family N-acetyltransferase [Yoonia sp.]|nr:GNAT family N-acetyltransferase [Yoonia sp.]